MKKSGAVLLALAVLGIVGAAGASSGNLGTYPLPPPPGPRPKPGGTDPDPDPEPNPGEPEAYYVGPGWFWWFVDWEVDGPAFHAFVAEHKGWLEVRKILGYPQMERYAVLILEIHQPIPWTLRGMPTPAPEGISTEWTDIEQAPPSEEIPAFWQWLEEVSKQPVDVLQQYDRDFQEWLNQSLGRLE